MDLIVGIDLGTTNSLIGVVEAGFPILLADDEGSRLTPSVVFQPPASESGGDGEKPGAILVGSAASRMRGMHPRQTYASIKRFMGSAEGDEEWARTDPAWREARDRPALAERLSAEILKHLKEVAERSLEQKVERAVITVPAYFNDAQRSATKRAGELAGFRVERILNEPTAAALAFGFGREARGGGRQVSGGEEHSRIAVYDFGGGTFDISILELTKGVFQVLSTHGDTRLGGDDIDRILAEWAWTQSGLPETLQDQEPATIRRVIDAARSAKEDLSDAAETVIAVPFVLPRRNLDASLDRDTFAKLIHPLLERTRACCVRALGDAGIGTPDLDEVILVGGTTRIPAVRSMVEAFFGRELNLSQHPDEAVALGATIQAGILSGSLSNVVLLDVTPLSLGIETFGGLMNVIIPRNTTIPAKAGEMFTNAVAGQESMRLRILQGEREMARDNWELGQVDIPFEPGAKGTARVGVQFSLDENGILNILARDTRNMKDHELRIESAAVDVHDEAVEAMISESVEHAFEDMNERIWTEARLKAEELLPAVRQGISQVGESLEPSEIEAMETAMLAMEQILSEGKEDPRPLKEATKRLDELTEPMAALLVEKAMSEALERKGPE